MTAEAKIIELLGWMQRHGMSPKAIEEGDRYLCPVTNKIVRGRSLNAYQRRKAFWIPTQKGLERVGLKVEKGRAGPLTTISLGPFFGAGCGEEEAALSMIQQIRVKLAA